MIFSERPQSMIVSEPARLRDRVIIEKGHVPAEGRAPSAVACDTKPDPFLPNVADHRSTLNRSDHLRRTIGGSIVDNDDLIVRPREFLIDNARNRLSEKIGPISRANDHGNEPFTRGHDVAPLPRKLERNPLA